jgi:hypothetical protein
VHELEILGGGHSVMVHEPAERGPVLPEVILADPTGDPRVHAETFLHILLDPCVHHPPKVHMGRIEGVVQVEHEERP